MERSRGVREDAGYSLAELLVAIVVGFLVLGAAYVLLETGMKAFRDIENTTAQSRAAADILDHVSKVMREGTGVSKASSYEIEFLADGDDDGTVERWRYYIDASSTSLMRQVGNPSNNTSEPVVTLSTIVRNRVTNIPLFTYYKVPGSALAGTSTVDARMVHLSVITQRQTAPLPAAYRAQLDVFLRNKGQ